MFQSFIRGLLLFHRDSGEILSLIIVTNITLIINAKFYLLFLIGDVAFFDRPARLFKHDFLHISNATYRGAAY